MSDPLAAFQSAVADRYAIHGRLGEGGMAIVFLANDLRHNRAVAVKVLRPEFAAVLGSERFLREINFAAELNHPHIVPLFDSGVVPAGGGHPALPFYVMPRLPGESLRERIAREGALPIEDAVEIARQVAQALAYAHARGIVHRDIKPANILLSDGEAVVADFGIARAVDRAGEAEQITDSGLTLGTPAYMAPEQTTGDTQLDGRADIYALGCVLYEMLGGSPPFSGATAAAILARHRTDAPPPLRTLRSTVPAQLEAVVTRALAKSPADRFPTALTMAQALGPASGSYPGIEIAPQRHKDQRRLRSRIALTIVGAAMIGILAWSVAGGTGFDGRRLVGNAIGSDDLDTTRYAVAPFVYDTGISVALNEGELIVNAVDRWGGVTVIDASQLRAARGEDPDAQHSDLSAWRTAAIALDAARLIYGRVRAVAGGLHVSASLIETSTGSVIARQSLRIIPTTAADSAFTHLADQLLLRTEDPTTIVEGPHPSMSLPARQAIARGMKSVSDWELELADSSFANAIMHDERSAAAAAWLALTRNWNGLPIAAWRSLVSRAAAGAEALAPRERRIVEALQARADANMVASCAAWRDLTREAPNDFVGWYGWAECQFSDDGVVRDRRSASGWRFSSSWNAALAAYQRAFELRPAIHKSLGGNILGGLRRKFLTSELARRGGTALAPDTGSFAGAPVWTGDTIAIIPYRTREFTELRLDAGALLEARRHLRIRLAETATAWASAYPAAAAPREVLAMAMELAGDRRAIDTLLAAQRLAVSSRDSARLSVREVWMRLRQADPGDPAVLLRIRRLADSLLAVPVKQGATPAERAGLAALTGRASLLAQLAARGELRELYEVDPALSPHVEQLVSEAAFGADTALVARHERAAGVAIDRSVAAPARESERMRWLAYSAMLAFPTYRSPMLRALSGKGDYLVDAAVAAASGRRDLVRRLLAAARDERTRVGISGLSMDALPAEAALLVWVEDTAAAITLLDASLRALGLAGAGSVEPPSHAAGFVRSAALRARLASLLDDTGAAHRWRNVPAVFWSDADEHVRTSMQGGTP